MAQVKRIWASRDMSRAEAARHGAFVEDALTEADAGAAADVEQGAAELPEPAFLDDEGPAADLPMPPYRTQNLPQILAGLTDDELATWPGDLADAERARRRKL